MPDPIIRSLFRRLSLQYGRAWAQQFEGMAADDVLEEWARALAPFGGRQRALEHAIANLPARPPSLPEFKRLCADFRGDTPPALPLNPAPADPARLAQALSPLARASSDPLAWAWRLAHWDATGGVRPYVALIPRTESQRAITPAQRWAYRRALAGPIERGEDIAAEAARRAAIEAAEDARRA